MTNAQLLKEVLLRFVHFKLKKIVFAFQFAHCLIFS